MPFENVFSKEISFYMCVSVYDPTPCFPTDMSRTNLTSLLKRKKKIKCLAIILLAKTISQQYHCLSRSYMCICAETRQF